MDTAALVNFDIENGEKVIEALDRDGKAPTVALWAKLPDYENWRLVIASNRLDQSSSPLAIWRSTQHLRRRAYRYIESRQFS
jgi:hypothetical protein